MKLLRIMGYDVVDIATGAIVSAMVPERETAESVVAATESPAVIVPVAGFAGGRIGYRVTQ